MENIGNQGQEAPVFKDVDDLLDYVFRESSPSTFDSRLDVSRPLTVVPSSLTSPSTLDSRSDVSRPLTVVSSPLASSVREMSEEKTVKPQRNFHEEMIKEEVTRPARLSEFKYWKEGIVAPGTDVEESVEESAEEAEKSPLKQIPQRQTFVERFSQNKALASCGVEKERQLQLAEKQIAFAKRQRPELRSVDELVDWAMKGPMKEERVLGKRQPQMVEGSGSESDSERAPARLIIPNDYDELLNEVMLAVPQDVLDCEGAGYNDKREQVHRLLCKKSTRELIAVHKKLFEHHPRDVPLCYARQCFIDNTRLLRAHPLRIPPHSDTDSDNDMDRKAKNKKIKNSKLAHHEATKGKSDRQALTDAERKRRQRWGTIDEAEIAKQKQKKSLKKKELRPEKRLEAQRLRRKKEKGSKIEQNLTIGQEDQ